jgi:hypothetical protein
MNSPPFDPSREHWAEPIPSEPHSLVADVDATFEQQILNWAKRQRKSDIHHHCEADEFG